MKRLDMKLEDAIDQATIRQQAEQLASLEEIRTLLYEKKIPVEMLEKYPSRFTRWLNENKGCATCKGLENCTQKTKGYRTGLLFDGILLDTVEACSYMLQKEQQESFLENYLVSDIGVEMKGIQFESIDLANESRTYLNEVLSKVIDYCDKEVGSYLYGNMGSGKTYLAVCASNRFAKQGKQVAFVHCPQFAERMRKTMKTEEYQKEMNRLMYADFVVFDDLGAEEITDRSRAVLLAILDARMQNHRCTWFTSNYDFKTLQQQYKTSFDGNNELTSMRILKRVRALAQPIEVIGQDRRKLSSMD